MTAPVTPTTHGTRRPVPTTFAAVAGVAAVGLILNPLADELTLSAQGLLLVLPVVAAAVVGGRLPAFSSAAAATLTFSLLIPPIGSPRVRLTQDTVALVVFTVVAMAISELVVRRIAVLDQLERHRRSLLRSVSHDLRTPLSTIMAASTTMLGESLEPAARRRLNEIVVDEAERLDRLVANLLSLSRIEAGALKPVLQMIDLIELIRFCTDRLERLSQPMELEILHARPLPPIPGDYSLLDQVLSNLLENAIRHTQKGGRVQLAVEPWKDGARIAVIDHGPGVDPGEREAIFRPFSSGTIRGVSGVGLAICKAIVEAHHGTIRASETPGGGATFTIELPGA